MNIWELGNLLEIAEMVTVCALERTESRGGHARDDYPKRDDVNWLKHTLAWVQEDGSDQAWLQTGRDHQVPAQGTGLLGKAADMDVKVKVFRFDPEIDKKPHYETYKIEAEPTDRVLDMLEYHQRHLRRHAVVPPFVCAWHLRLGRHAHQRAQLPGMQGAAQRPAFPQHYRRAADGPARDQGPDRGHGAFLRQLPAGDALFRQR